MTQPTSRTYEPFSCVHFIKQQILYMIFFCFIDNCNCGFNETVIDHNRRMKRKGQQKVMWVEFFFLLMSACQQYEHFSSRELFTFKTRMNASEQYLWGLWFAMQVEFSDGGEGCSQISMQFIRQMDLINGWLCDSYWINTQQILTTIIITLSLTYFPKHRYIAIRWLRDKRFFLLHFIWNLFPRPPLFVDGGATAPLHSFKFVDFPT